MRDNYWLDIGTPPRYWQAHQDLLAGKIRTFPPQPRGEFEAAHTADIDQTSIIGDNCTIKPGARIVNSVLGAGVHVEEKAMIENSVIWAHSIIETQAVVIDSIIGRGCHIGRFAVVAANSVLGDKTNLTDYTQV